MQISQAHKDSITDIRTLSATEKTMDKNVVWVGRMAGYTALNSFLNKIGLLGSKQSSYKPLNCE